MNKAVYFSFLIHAAVLLPIVVLTVVQQNRSSISFENIEFQVIEKTVKPPENEVIKEQPQEINAVSQQKNQSPAENSKPAKKVFGLQKNTLTDQSNASGVAIKKGNTVLKEQDNEVAENDDPLPVPVAEYVVSQMPRLIKEVIPEYPQEAKNNNLETSVAIDILIDKNGNVRQATLLEDPGMGLGEAARQAVLQYKFKPAQIGDKTVAIEIRYYVEFKIN